MHSYLAIAAACLLGLGCASSKHALRPLGTLDQPEDLSRLYVREKRPLVVVGTDVFVVASACSPPDDAAAVYGGGQAAPALSSGEQATPALSSGEQASPALSSGEQATPALSSGEQATPALSSGEQATPALSSGSASSGTPKVYGASVPPPALGASGTPLTCSPLRDGFELEGPSGPVDIYVYGRLYRNVPPGDILFTELMSRDADD